jgi:hypothetical protein
MTKAIKKSENTKEETKKTTDSKSSSVLKSDELL